MRKSINIRELQHARIIDKGNKYIALNKFKCAKQVRLIKTTYDNEL